MGVTCHQTGKACRIGWQNRQGVVKPLDFFLPRQAFITIAYRDGLEKHFRCYLGNVLLMFFLFHVVGFLSVIFHCCIYRITGAGERERDLSWEMWRDFVQNLSFKVTHHLDCFTKENPYKFALSSLKRCLFFLFLSVVHTAHKSGCVGMPTSRVIHLCLNLVSEKILSISFNWS